MERPLGSDNELTECGVIRSMNCLGEAFDLKTRSVDYLEKHFVK
ncbi:MAG TPA: hypothetical protein PLG41_24060 [Leptospiraceae bacterium]|nr:hypothetical protein [Leptospiraceae bacterium]